MIILYRGRLPYLLMKTITILAMFAILAGATITTAGSAVITSVLAQTDNATMTGNMTGGNMTGGNMTAGGGNTTDADATGQISGKSR